MSLTKVFFMVSVIGLLSGCWPAYHETLLTTCAAEYINPGREGSPHPVQLSIYSLTNPQRFQQASYWDLQHKPYEVLRHHLLDKIDTPIFPGECKRVRIMAGRERNYLGVIGGFRELQKTRWRSVRERNPLWPRFYLTITSQGLLWQ